jgi:Holliday junction resolvase RusA-like endonuclease
MPDGSFAPASPQAAAAELFQITREQADAAAALSGASARDVARALAFVEAAERDNPAVEVRFELAGECSPAARVRVTRFGKHDPNAQEKANLTGRMERELPAGFVPFQGEVELFLDVYRSVKKGWPPYKAYLAELGYLRPDVRPDYDNYAKLLTDALMKKVFVDDGQVVVGNVRLFYSARPRIEILLVGRQRRLTT